MEEIIKNRLVNIQYACLKCGYGEDESIKSQIYFKIFNNIIPPKKEILNFEFLDEKANLFK